MNTLHERPSAPQIPPSSFPDIGTARYHDGGRFVAVLYRRGRTRLHLVFVDEPGIRHLAVPLEEQRYLRPLEHRGQGYPIERFVRQLRKTHRPITESARAELARIPT